ncbi:hypothetical protein IAE57_02430 [Stenotrophomonas sp. S48]|uniref:hypothetical protein n=1 Tax=unclassified Stenotrophomonas TaxID=196198 RepID=UPI0019012071|nr:MULTISPECIES: hypothetical protein [unclassified Stenotrophomonas]MBK0025006.1 hypothetical protein [Stenotrophomonas sp. S48]MBK0046710.1 hypothetical protein [Stenotrophomonas sp. S49]
MDFKPLGISAIDESSGVSIPQPRMLPATLPGGGTGIEFQYAFRRNGERIGGLGILGKETALVTDGHREWLYKLEITHHSAFDSIFRLKRKIGNTDDDFIFLSTIAEGLVAVFVGSHDNVEPQRNVVVTSLSALNQQGILVPEQIPFSQDGEIVLADAYVPGSQPRAVQP